jgi:hypothetical protein
MNERDIQDKLMTLMDNLIDAKDEVEGDDDDSTLADIARDMVDTFHQIVRAKSFDDAMLLTSNEGVILNADDGSEFQITIVQSRHPA